MLDRTIDFRLIVKERDLHIKNHSRSAQCLKQTNVGKTDSLFSTKAFVAEASKIFSHIMELSKTLTYIRRPYLSVEAANFRLAHSSRAFDLNNLSQQLSSIKYFNEEERDRIDRQLGDMASTLATKIKDLEALEKKRLEFVATNVNPVLRLLPARLVSHPDNLVSDFVAAHHAGILLYLNRRLSQASQTVKDVQEERIRRQKEITKTLGAGASKEVSAWQNQSNNSESDHEGTRWSNLASNIASTITNSYLPSKPIHNVEKFESKESIYRSYEEQEQYHELSPSQILLFEQENADMLQSMQHTLASVQQAEARLLDISALQMELLTHLAQQTQITEQLFDDAVMTSSMVEKGNTQLKEAKRRAKDSRLFLLVFIFGASFALLFVHLY